MERIIALYETSVALPEVQDDITSIVVHMEDDVEPGEPCSLCVIDYEFHGHSTEDHYQTAPVVDRRVLAVPNPLTLQSLFIRAGVDVYCQVERDRCFAFHNLRPILSQHSPRIPLEHGDYIKIVIPPSENCAVPTQQLLIDYTSSCTKLMPLVSKLRAWALVLTILQVSSLRKNCVNNFNDLTLRK